MASKQVTDREKSARSVIAAGETNAEVVQNAVADMVAPLLKKGEEAPDFGAVILAACKLLGAVNERMIKADEAHEVELADDPPVRDARDSAVAELRSTLIELREMIVGAYGPATAGKVFLGGTPEDPVVVARFAGEVADNLGKVKLPAPRIKGAKLDVAEVVSSLKEGRAGVEEHLGHVQREAREAQKTLAARNTAIPAYDRVFAGVATTLSGLLLLAGEIELAAKVRPSTRRPGQTAEDAGETSEPAPAPVQ
jgi:hypothetical protein